MFNDNTIMQFGQKKGQAFKDIEPWWFRSFWKQNDYWYHNTKRKGISRLRSSYDKQRYFTMKYIEDNFPSEQL